MSEVYFDIIATNKDLYAHKYQDLPSVYYPSSFMTRPMEFPNPNPYLPP
jgi:hypothetical protein